VGAQLSDNLPHTPPFRLVIDKAPYHVAAKPSIVDASSLSKKNLLRMCVLYDVTENHLRDAGLQTKKGKGSGAVGDDISKASLAPYLASRMVSQRNRLEILLWMRTKSRHRGGEWVMEYEVCHFH